MHRRVQTKELRQFRAALNRNLVFVGMYSLFVRRLPDFHEALRTIGDEETRSLLSEGLEYLRETTTPEESRRMCFEVLVCRSVDTFLFYLSSVLMRVFIERSETLKTGETITVREVLECADLEEFIKCRAEGKVIALAYKGLPEIIDYLNSQLGLGFTADTPAFVTACEFVQVRNIIVHNAGLVNSVFLRRTGRTDLQADAEYPLTKGYLFSGLDSLVGVARELDRLLVSHFKLETEEIEEETATTDTGQ